MSERITHAQKRLLELIKERKLRKWCTENGLSHSTAHSAALGKRASYRIMASMCHIIAPVEWLFFEDEELPYAPSVVPKWDSHRFSKSKFISSHKQDWRDMAKNIGISEDSAYRIFVSGRLMPSLTIMRECCAYADPIEFFIEGDEQPALPRKRFVPDRGDVVSILTNTVLVLSSKAFAARTGKFVCCPVVPKCARGVELKTPRAKGFADCDDIRTCEINAKSQPKIMDVCDKKTLEKALRAARKILE